MAKPKRLADQKADAIRKKISENVKRLRADRSQADVYQGAGVSKFTLQQTEYSHANPSIETLMRLADYFGVNLEDIIK